MKKKLNTLIITLMSMALLCSCNNTEIVSYDNNNNPEITQKNTYSSDVEKITNDENMEYTRENLNDEFIYIKDEWIYKSNEILVRLI